MSTAETLDPATLTRVYSDMVLRAGNCIGLVPFQYRAAANGALAGARTAFFYHEYPTVELNCMFIFEKAGVNPA
jgi:hypothetical protein